MIAKAPEVLVDQILEEIADENVEKLKRCPVPHNRLTIESNGTVMDGCTVDHLFDEKFDSKKN